MLCGENAGLEPYLVAMPAPVKEVWETKRKRIAVLAHAA